MSDRINYILTFAFGVGIGVLASFKLASAKAEERADIEIEEMRRYFQSKNTKPEKPEATKKNVEPEKKEKTATVSDTPVNYTLYSDIDPDDPVVSTEPVVLRDENEWREKENYDVVYLTYYDDSILAEDETRTVYNKHDAEAAIGAHTLDEFDVLMPDGQPKDLIQVRNDRTRTYYEISRSYDDYAAVGWEDDGEDDY